MLAKFTYIQTQNDDVWICCDHIGLVPANNDQLGQRKNYVVFLLALVTIHWKNAFLEPGPM